MRPQYQTLKAEIGSRTTIENWPTPDLDGLFQALKQWTLDPRLSMHDEDPTHPHAAFDAPFRCLAWGSCKAEPIPGSNGRRRYVGTKPIYEEHPEAVGYTGNFLGYSYCFNIDTSDPALIAELDRLIAENMATQEYIQAANEISRRRRH